MGEYGGGGAPRYGVRIRADKTILFKKSFDKRFFHVLGEFQFYFDHWYDRVPDHVRTADRSSADYRFLKIFDKHTRLHSRFRPPSGVRSDVARNGTGETLTRGVSFTRKIPLKRTRRTRLSIRFDWTFRDGR